MAAILAPAGAQGSTGWTPAVTARQTLSTRLARLSGSAIADAIGKDHTAASRIASGERGATLDEWLALLELCGLKLVDKNKLCVSKEQHEFMRRTTARAMANEQIAALLFEDPE